MDLDEWVDLIEKHVVHGMAGQRWWPISQTIDGYIRQLEPGDTTARYVDAALGRVARIPNFKGAYASKLRITMQRRAYAMTRGMRGSVERVMPNADTRWVATVDEAMSTWIEALQDGVRPLEGVSGGDVKRLHAAWSALDWDGTLRTENLFGRPPRQPDFRKRPWAPLAKMIAETTSYDRLKMGESGGHILSTLFARKDVSVDEKTELAVALANRGKGAGWMATDGIELVTLVLAPHLVADNRPLPAVLARAGKKLATSAEHAVLFERLAS